MPVQQLREFVDPDNTMSQRGFAKRLMVPPSTMDRYGPTGIPWDHADRIVHGIGLHPAEVWPDEWAEGPFELSELFTQLVLL
jgi:hypothetical protein